MEISKNLKKAYLALLADLWSRQRILGLEFNHIQHNCIELLNRGDLLKCLNKNTFYMYMDAGNLIKLEPKTRERESDDNILLRQRYAERIFHIAGNLQKEILKDHQLLRVMIDGSTYQKNRFRVATDLCPKLYSFLKEIKGISVLEWNFDALLDEITLKFAGYTNELKNISSSDDTGFIEILIKHIFKVVEKQDAMGELFKEDVKKKHYKEDVNPPTNINPDKFLKTSVDDIKKILKKYDTAVEKYRSCKCYGFEDLKSDLVKSFNEHDEGVENGIFKAEMIAKLFRKVEEEKPSGDNSQKFEADSFPFLGLGFLLNTDEEKDSAKINDKDFRYFYYTIIALKTKIAKFSEELGVLTKRISELLRQKNPNQMGIAGFQRQEYPFYDLFFRTFADQSFRDLLLFCKDEEFLNSPYPYNEDKMASLIHIYTHEDVSSVRPMVREDHHIKWKKWLYSDDLKSNTFDLTDGSNAVAVLNSFYTELPTSIPIITHELAHHVIKEFVGLYARPELFTQRNKHGFLGRFFREYFSVIHRFLPQDATPDDSFLHTEILADLLAATRLGTSYLYAWFMEMPGSSPLDYIHMLDEYNYVIPQNIPQFAEQGKPDIHNVVPVDYIRGVFLIELIFALYPNKCNKKDKKCKQDNELIEAFSEHIDTVLDIRYRSNPEIAKSWKLLRYYARRVLYRSGFVRKAQRFHEYFKTSEESIKTKKTKKTKESKKTKNSYFSNSQLLSNEYFDILRDLADGFKSHDLKEEVKSLFIAGKYSPSEAVDLSWRIAWIASSRAQIQAVDGNEDMVYTAPIGNQFQTITELMLIENIAREDYMAKVMGLNDIWRIVGYNDLKLNHQIYNDLKAPLIKEKSGSSNIISRTDPLDFKNSKEVKEALKKTNKFKLVIIDKGENYKIPPNFDLKVKEDFSYKKTNLKVLELFRFSESKTPPESNGSSKSKKTQEQKNNVLGDEFKDNFQYSQESNETEKKSNYGRTLGYYDFFVIHDYRPNSGHVYRNDSYPYLKNIQTYSRRRILVPFKIELGDEKNEKAPNIFGLILIRLRMQSLRLVFLAWLTHELKDSKRKGPERKDSYLYKSFLDIYMSQGSEDFVIFLNANALEKDLFETIRYLGDNPLVEKTETILTREVFKKESEKLNFNFLVSVSDGEQFIKGFKEFKELENLYSEEQITLTQLNGEMDLRICLGTKMKKEKRNKIFEFIRTNDYVQKLLTDVGYNHLSAKSDVK